MRDDDRVLVERARSGDLNAIEALFSRYWRAARAAAYGVTNDLASAEDAAADAFRDVWGNLATLRDPDRFGPWLRTIVLRKARLSRRRRRAVESSETAFDGLADPGEMPDRALQRLELDALIHLLVRELSPRLRESVSLFYFEGYDSDEAARFLDIPPGTFRRRLHEARRELRAALDNHLQRKGAKSMSTQRDREIERVRGLLDAADKGNEEAMFQAFRDALSIRPVSRDLLSEVASHRAATPSALDQLRAAPAALQDRVREALRQYGVPSARAQNPEHPVGAVAAAIREALPDAQEWTFDLGDAAMKTLSSLADARDMIEVLPPGLADGRPGLFMRAARAVLFDGEGGSVRTMYQFIGETADRSAFRSGITSGRRSDVLNVTWAVGAPLDLRSVQALIERILAAVLPETSYRAAPYDEPRYRAGLRVQLDGDMRPAAIGGVLGEWAALPAGIDAAHLRIYLEPWAAARSGQVVDLEPPFIGSSST